MIESSDLAAVSSSSRNNVDKQPKQPNWPAIANYKLVDVGLEKQWTADETGEPSRWMSTHAWIRTKSQFRRQLSWATNKIWRVSWEALCPSVGGRPGPRPPGPPLNPALRIISCLPPLCDIVGMQCIFCAIPNGLMKYIITSCYRLPSVHWASLYCGF